MKALLDADVMAYRAAAACKEESVETATATVDRIVLDALLSCDVDDKFYDKWQLYLTGNDNFRKQISNTYKANRTAPKPEHLPALRQHLIEQWGAVVAEGQEADDAIAIEATKLNGDFVIISIDKDFKQVPGHHYNFVKREHFFVTPDEGLRFLYMQILMGDTADNVIGIKGIGPKKAEAALAECTTEQEMADVCYEMYTDVDKVRQNATLLYLRRKENELWTPPTPSKKVESLTKESPATDS